MVLEYLKIRIDRIKKGRLSQRRDLCRTVSVPWLLEKETGIRSWDKWYFCLLLLAGN